MGFAQRLAEYEKPRVGARCATCMIVDEASPDDREALLAAMDDPRISNAGMARIFREEGFHVGESAIRRHRKGECKGL